MRTTRIAAMSGLVALVVSITTIAAGAQFSPWGPATNAEAIPGTSTELNTPYLDGCPIQSPDGLSLYMASNRPGGLGGLDIWVAHRSAKDAPWEAPVNLGEPVNSSADDFCPTPTRARFFFISSRDGGCGGPDIYVTRLRPGGWLPPQNVGCDVNSSAGEASPSFVKAGGSSVLYFSSTRPGGFAPEEPGVPPDSDIYLAVMGPGGAFGPAALAPGLNTASEDSRPNVRSDGLEVVFDSNRPGTLGGPDIYSATRESVDDAWSEPVHLDSSVNSPSSETRASLSWDGRTLYFGSNRPGSELDPVTGLPSSDIYVSTRDRVR